MTKATLGAAAMVAILSLIPALVLAPAASASPRGSASVAHATTASGSSPVVTNPLPAAVRAAIGLELNVDAGAVCLLGETAADLAEALGIDPGVAAQVVTYCTQFLGPDATQAGQNAGMLGTALGTIANNLPIVGGLLGNVPSLPNIPLPL